MFRAAVLAVLSFILSNCASANSAVTAPLSQMELKVSVKDQKLALYDRGQPVRVYGVSTSKYGVGDSNSSYRTPLGKLSIADKIGEGQPAGMVFKGRKATGEVLRPNAPGRDPIVSRILWLSGAEAKNGNAYDRCIYIHGTPEERSIGRPSSYGCVRMRSMDIIDLYSRISLGTQVTVTTDSLPGEAKRLQEYVYRPPVRPRMPSSGPGKSNGVYVRKLPAASTSGSLSVDNAPKLPTKTGAGTGPVRVYPRA
jgi:hypothetical protein